MDADEQRVAQRALTAKERAAVALRDQGLSWTKIGSRLGISESAARDRFRRGDWKLRQAIEEEEITTLMMAADVG